jgi:hypothetical protein
MSLSKTELLIERDNLVLALEEIRDLTEDSEILGIIDEAIGSSDDEDNEI